MVRYKSYFYERYVESKLPDTEITYYTIKSEIENLIYEINSLEEFSVEDYTKIKILDFYISNSVYRFNRKGLLEFRNENLLTPKDYRFLEGDAQLLRKLANFYVEYREDINNFKNEFSWEDMLQRLEDY